MEPCGLIHLYIKLDKKYQNIENKKLEEDDYYNIIRRDNKDKIEYLCEDKKENDDKNIEDYLKFIENKNSKNIDHNDDKMKIKEDDKKLIDDNNNIVIIKKDEKSENDEKEEKIEKEEKEDKIEKEEKDEIEEKEEKIEIEEKEEKNEIEEEVEKIEIEQKNKKEEKVGKDENEEKIEKPLKTIEKIIIAKTDEKKEHDNFNSIMPKESEKQIKKHDKIEAIKKVETNIKNENNKKLENIIIENLIKSDKKHIIININSQKLIVENKIESEKKNIIINIDSNKEANNNIEINNKNINKNRSKLIKQKGNNINKNINIFENELDDIKISITNPILDNKIQEKEIFEYPYNDCKEIKCCPECSIF